MTEPHAVRWARRELKREMRLDFTQWHWTADGCFTLCQRVIPVGLEGTFFPETDDRPEQVTCRSCRRSVAFNQEHHHGT